MPDEIVGKDSVEVEMAVEVETSVEVDSTVDEEVKVLVGTTMAS